MKLIHGECLAEMDIKMNVLSLFSGIDSAYQSLLDAGIKINNYYACEIDKYARAVSRYNFPQIIHLGDVKQVDWFGLPKIDILLAGSPCQGFSFAGKQLAFDDPRSALFWEFVRIKNELQPKYFLLENVVMKKEFQQVITDAVGVQPVMINSALVSAQNRKRLYWANFNITQPQDKGILLKDIIENGDVDRNKSLVVTSRVSGATSDRYINKAMHQMVITGGAMRGRYLDDNGKRLDATVDSQAGLTTQRIETRIDGKSNCLTSVQKDSLCIQVGKADINGIDQIKRVYSPNGKCPTLSTMQGGHREPKVSADSLTWRKLIPLECERLQTYKDNFTQYGIDDNGKQIIISNSQRYKMCGNGWNQETITHIFNCMI